MKGDYLKESKERSWHNNNYSAICYRSVGWLSSSWSRLQNLFSPKPRQDPEKLVAQTKSSLQYHNTRITITTKSGLLCVSKAKISRPRCTLSCFCSLRLAHVCMCLCLPASRCGFCKHVRTQETTCLQADAAATSAQKAIREKGKGVKCGVKCAAFTSTGSADRVVVSPEWDTDEGPSGWWLVEEEDEGRWEEEEGARCENVQGESLFDLWKGDG